MGRHRFSRRISLVFESFSYAVEGCSERGWLLIDISLFRNCETTQTLGFSNSIILVGRFQHFRSFCTSKPHYHALREPAITKNDEHAKYQSLKNITPTKQNFLNRWNLAYLLRVRESMSTRSYKQKRRLLQKHCPYIICSVSFGCPLV